MSITNKYRPGFTLIEIMVVLAIICLLIVITVPVYQTNVRISKVTKIVSKLNSLQSEVSEQFLLNGQWPDTLNSYPVSTVSADTSFPIVTNFLYDNDGNSKAWFGYKLNSDFGNGWIFMMLLYNGGVFEVHCGSLTTGCDVGDHGECDSYPYFPSGCQETDLGGL